jgi:hypothetical protein
MEYQDLTETIIGCAYRVYNKMGFGFLEEVQLVNYLVATGKPAGMILNFGETKVEIKRKVKDLNQEINRMKKQSS